jgi:thiol-disulfide isomerase/thioredoxin
MQEIVHHSGLMDDAAYEVVCICAAWCGTCTEYRPGFEALAAQFPQAAFKWLDTEDDADEVGDLEIENFPTLLVRRGPQTLFFGPQPPSHDVLKRLLQTLIK